MRHLFLALNSKGYGETILGVRIARELYDSGDECLFLIHNSATSLLIETPFKYMTISDHAIPLLKVILLAFFKKTNPDSIILSDYFTTALAFQRAGIDPSLLVDFGIPIGAIDTWDMRRSGTAIDVFGGGRRRFQDWSRFLNYRLIPVPIANPTSDASYYCGLPEPARLANKVRRHIRRTLGIPEDGLVVLFCTADWQHARFRSEHANRIARLLPFLVGQYVRKLGSRLHLVHVGPSAYPIGLDDLYHWLPPLRPERFDMLLGSVDLLMVANVSSTSIAKALVAGIPTVALVNSYDVASVDELRQVANGEIPQDLVTWVEEAGPLYPFRMWPIGYHKFLAPLLQDNRFCEVVPMLEILQQQHNLDVIGALLFDEQARGVHIRRQARYVEELRRLPSAGSLVSKMVSVVKNECSG